MDADIEYRVTRSGRRVRQLIVIPDADLSDVEPDSDDDTDIGTAEHNGQSSTESEWSTDDDLPLATYKDGRDSGAAIQDLNLRKKHVFRWRSMREPAVDTTWKDSLPDAPNAIDSPIGYFKRFLTTEMIQQIVSETNRYAVQSGSSFKTNTETVERFIGILLRMGIVHMPRYRMYWSGELRYNAIADYMSRREFEEISRFIHFNDNSKVVSNRKEPSYDPLFKIRPLLESLRQQCLQVAPDQRQSIDEQIIPFKGRNQLRQYLPKKPKRWGFKVIARCCSRTGFTHDFTIYQGGPPQLPDEESVGYQPGDFVLQMCKSLPQHKNYILYFDNWFNFPELQLKLKELGFNSVGTLRANRLRGCSLTSESDLRKKGRGSYDSKVDANSGLSVIRWYDNRAVQISSTHVGVHPLTTMKRWDRKAKKFVDVHCPAAIVEYNANMGGVDLFDMLSAMYRIDHKSLKWYRRIFYWALNVACINSWILYKRHCTQLAVPRNECLDLLGFVAQVSQYLIVANKPAILLARKRGRPSTAAVDDATEDDAVSRQKKR